jgi:hypothetical protein
MLVGNILLGYPLQRVGRVRACVRACQLRKRRHCMHGCALSPLFNRGGTIGEIQSFMFLGPLLPPTM